MAARDRTRITVELPDGMMRELEEAVEDEEYLSKADAVRQGLRMVLSDCAAQE